MSCIEYSHNVTLKNEDNLNFDIEVKGVLIKIKKKVYLTVPHAGLDVKIIIFNDKEYTDFKYSHWSENIIVCINSDDILEHQYVFKKFGVKCIDFYQKFTLNNYNCKYVKNDYFPVNMMPENPELMFYTMRSEQEDSPDTGTPLHYNGILYGIFSRYNKVEDFCYILPYLFIQKSIENKTNYLYHCTNIKDIGTISKYKIHGGNMIYCPQLRYNINIETYLLYLSNSSARILINGSLDRYIVFKKEAFSKVNNSYLLHWCKMFNKEILMDIIKGYNSRCKKNQFEINGVKQVFVYN